MLDSLINDIYASAATPDALPRTIARIGAAVGADSSFLFSSHSAVSPDAILLGHQLGGKHIEQFARYWSHEDIWALEAGRRQLMRRNTVVIGTDLVGERAQLDSRFYREFGRDAGMHRISAAFSPTAAKTPASRSRTCAGIAATARRISTAAMPCC